MAEFVIVAEGLQETVDSLNELPPKTRLALQRALNRVADKTRTRLAKDVRMHVAFPASYLNPGGGRLKVAERARPGKLSIKIEGRDQPTSLARFVAGASRRKTGVAGVRPRVTPGHATYMPRAFLIQLKNGNTGLAVRGKRPSNAYKPKLLANGLWLLYGPSVDQVLNGAYSRAGGLFGDNEEWAIDELEAEFWRLMKVDID